MLHRKLGIPHTRSIFYIALDADVVLQDVLGKAHDFLGLVMLRRVLRI
jgi:hypothetical protein